MTREQVYGRRAVREALRGPREVLELWVTERALKAEPWLREPGPSVRHQAKAERDLTEAAGTREHEGVLAFCEPYRYGDAAELAAKDRPEVAARLGALRDDLVDAVLAAVPDAVLRGDPDPAGRLPGNAHFTFPGCEGDSLLYLLDARGVECSTGSACQAGVPQPSHVLLAMGVDPDAARGALRFSLGWPSTADDVAALAAAIGPVVERARAAHR